MRGGSRRATPWHEAAPMSFHRSRLVLGSLLVSVVGCETSGPSESTHEETVSVVSEALSVADCPAGYNIIQGTSKADTLIGTAGNERVRTRIRVGSSLRPSRRPAPGRIPPPE